MILFSKLATSFNSDFFLLLPMKEHLPVNVFAKRGRALWSFRLHPGLGRDFVPSPCISLSPSSLAGETGGTNSS